MTFRFIPLLAFALLGLCPLALACSTLAAGRLATSDGSVIISQTTDGDGNDDARIVRVPAADWPPNSRRKIIPDYSVGFPRYVGTDRGAPLYFPTGSDPLTNATGDIPQVAHTFAYYDGDYGMMNEWGVAIAESSTTGRIVAPSDKSVYNSRPLFPIEELSRVALERCNTSRCAVSLMGQLAETYGFYPVLRGDSDAALKTVPNEGGESLLVGDSTEAWIFHILSDGGQGAIWCAQRVEDDEFVVVANMMVIRNVDLADAKGNKFMFSSSMTAVAQAKGWWQPGTSFDFTKIFSYGEYFSEGYSSRRMWRALSLVAPSLKLNPEHPQPLFMAPFYPIGVVPDQLLQPQAFFSIYRDTYANTSYDMAQGLAAAPWGLPVRFDPEQAYKGSIPGNWERPIGLFRTVYSWVAQLRPASEQSVGSVFYWAPHTPLGATYVPFFAASLSVPSDVDATSRADPRVFDRTSLYWTNRFIINVAYARYSDMHAMISDQQLKAEATAVGMVALLDAQAKTVTPADLFNATSGHASFVLDKWWQLVGDMMVQWSDGFYQSGFDADKQPNYPTSWLQAVGYADGPRDAVPNPP